MSSLTNAQSRAIEIVPRIMAGLSVCGSFCVLWSVLRNKQKGAGSNGGERRQQQRQEQGRTSSLSSTVERLSFYNKRNDQRNSISRSRQSSSGLSSSSSSRPRKQPVSQVAGNLLMCLSLMDLLSSMSYVIGGVLFPVEAGGKGNQATCNAQGFFCNLQVGAALYSGFLAWYYYLVLTWARKPFGKTRLWRFEVCVHIFCWAFVITTGVVAIVKGLYNPHWVRCYIAGPNTGQFFWGFFYAPIWASMISGTVAMAIIYQFVRKTETKGRKWSSMYQINRQISAKVDRGTGVEQQGTQAGLTSLESKESAARNISTNEVETSGITAGKPDEESSTFEKKESAPTDEAEALHHNASKNPAMNPLLVHFQVVGQASDPSVLEIQNYPEQDESSIKRWDTHYRSYSCIFFQLQVVSFRQRAIDHRTQFDCLRLHLCRVREYLIGLFTSSCRD